MRKDLRINFVDFWPEFQKNDNYFFHLLSQKYEIILDESNPDIVFGSFGFSNSREINRYENHHSLKVYYTGESDDPRGRPYDVNITQRRGIESDLHVRMPLWSFFCSWFGENSVSHERDPSVLCPVSSLISPQADFEKIYDQKRKFCSFLYADNTHERSFWFDQVSRISPVESAGSARNNTGFRIAGRGDQIHKLNYLSEFFFSLAIENKGIDGYLTEKMLHPLSVFSIPIYWGDPGVSLDFNDRCFIDARSRRTNEVLEEINELLNNRNLYLEKMSSPRIDLERINFTPERMISFLEINLEKKRNQK